MILCDKLLPNNVKFNSNTILGCVVYLKDVIISYIQRIIILSTHFFLYLKFNWASRCFTLLVMINKLILSKTSPLKNFNMECKNIPHEKHFYSFCCKRNKFWLFFQVDSRRLMLLPTCKLCLILQICL